MTSLAYTTRDTVHGYPERSCRLPAGTLVWAEPADNLPDDSPIQWWVRPTRRHPWKLDGLKRIEETIGVGLHRDDLYFPYNI